MHPLHPALVHFPLAFLLGGSAAHMVYAFADSEKIWDFSLWLIGAGLCASLPAVLAGAYDFYVYIIRRKRTEFYSKVSLHMMAMISAIFVYATCFIYGFKAGADDVSVSLILVLSLSAAAILIIGGWLGGELVYRHGCGIITDQEKTEDPDT